MEQQETVHLSDNSMSLFSAISPVYLQFFSQGKNEIHISPLFQKCKRVQKTSVATFFVEIGLQTPVHHIITGEMFCFFFGVLWLKNLYEKFYFDF